MEDKVRTAQPDGHGRGIGIAGDMPGDHGTIRDPQALNTVYAKARIDHGIGIAAHAAGPDCVQPTRRKFAECGENIFIALNLCAGDDFGPYHVTQRWGCDERTHGADQRYGRCAVMFGGKKIVPDVR